MFEQSGDAAQPVVLEPGGQHCAAMLMAWVDERFVYAACLGKKPLQPDVPTSAVNPGNVISDLLSF
jgi:hypothetical protein